MPLWRRLNSESADLNRRSEERLINEGLPSQAASRLDRKGAWASTLSVSGLLVSARLGLEPLGQVMGSSVMHVGFTASWLYNAWREGDIRPLSQVMTIARRNALDRLRHEAQQLGAHGVVDVTLRRSRPSWGSGLFEFTATGTAVRYSGMAAPKVPFLGNMSARDSLALSAAGYIPVNLVFSTTAYYVLATWVVERMERSWANQEIGSYSTAVYRARDLVVENLARQAQAAGADGILGSEWEMDVEPIQVNRPTVDRSGQMYGMMEAHEDHVLYLTITGTAIGETTPSPTVGSIPLGFSLKDGSPNRGSLTGEKR